MIVDEVTNCLIQGTIDDGGKVYVFNQSEKFEVVSANNGQITINSGSYEFQVGDKLSFIYEPKYSAPYCEEYTDTDGDGIIDIVDLDADGDGVIDPRLPLSPSHVVTELLLAPDAPSLVTIVTSPLTPSVVRSRVYGEALIVDGYYPVYVTVEEALLGSPLATPSADEVTIGNDVYYMPDGVDKWMGDYFTCPPKTPTNCIASVTNTYDFEYVDRVIANRIFSSIVPYDYREQLIGIDTDENGSFDTTATYSLVNSYNIFDEFDSDGNLLSAGDTKYSHYDTNPKQSWIFVVTEKNTSENVLPSGHSFALGNHVLYPRTFTKFDASTDDSRDHTRSIFKYYSQLANGNNANLTASSSASIIYHNYETDDWVKVEILEINAAGYIVLDEDIFDVADKFYIYVESFPNAPSNVSVSVGNVPTAPSNVFASKANILPDAPSNVQILQLTAPLIPDPVEADLYIQQQSIIWQQFDSDIDTALVEANDINVNANYDFGFAVAPSNVEAAFEVFDNNSLSLKLQRCKPGAKLSYNEGFYHPIEADIKDVYLGRTLITNSQYNQIMTGNSDGYNPSPSVRGNRPTAPVDNVSYQEGIKFCEILTEQEASAGRLPTGYVYSLPTASEWEHFYSENNYYPDFFDAVGYSVAKEKLNPYGNMFFSDPDPVSGNPQLYDPSISNSALTTGNQLMPSGIRQMIGHVYEHVLDRGYLPFHQEHYGQDYIDTNAYRPAIQAMSNSLLQYTVKIGDRGLNLNGGFNQASTFSLTNPCAYMEDVVTISRTGQTYNPLFTGYKGIGQINFGDYHNLTAGMHLRRNTVGSLSTGNAAYYGLDDTFYTHKWIADHIAAQGGDANIHFSNWFKGLSDTFQQVATDMLTADIKSYALYFGLPDNNYMNFLQGPLAEDYNFYENVFDRQSANEWYGNAYFHGLSQPHYEYYAKGGLYKTTTKPEGIPWWVHDRVDPPFVRMNKYSNSWDVETTWGNWGRPKDTDPFKPFELRSFNKADGSDFDTVLESVLPNFGLRICLVKEEHRSFMNSTSRTISYEY